MPVPPWLPGVTRITSVSSMSTPARPPSHLPPPSSPLLVRHAHALGAPMHTQHAHALGAPMHTHTCCEPRSARDAPSTPPPLGFPPSAEASSLLLPLPPSRTPLGFPPSVGASCRAALLCTLDVRRELFSYMTCIWTCMLDVRREPPAHATHPVGGMASFSGLREWPPIRERGAH